MATETRRERAPSGNGGSPPETPRGAEARAQPAPLDMLLSEAAVGPVQRWNPGMAGLKAAVKLALRPRTVARRGAALAAELTKVAAGRSEVGPAKTDRRFKDPAWSGNPAFRRLGQSYLAAARRPVLRCRTRLVRGAAGAARCRECRRRDRADELPAD